MSDSPDCSGDSDVVWVGSCVAEGCVVVLDVSVST